MAGADGPTSAKSLARAGLPLAAAALGGLAQHYVHAGVERGLLWLTLAAALLPVLDLAARAFSARRPSSGHDVAVLAATLLGVAAVFVYPLPLAGASLVLAIAGAAAVRETVGSLLWRAAGPLLVASGLAVAAVTHAVAAHAPPGYDASLYLLDARFLLEGALPYRDVHLNKLPMILLPNLAFVVIGSTQAAPQILSFSIAVATAALLAGAPAVRRTSTRGLVAGAALLLLSLESYRQGGGFPETYVPPLLGFAWSRLAWTEPRRRDLALGGAALGLAACFKQTQLVYLVVGVGATLAAELTAGARTRRERVLRAAACVGGALVPIGIVVAGLAFAGLSGPCWESCFVYWWRLPIGVAQASSTLARLRDTVFLPAWPALVATGIAAGGAFGRMVGGRPLGRPLAGWLLLVGTGAALQLVEQAWFANPHYVTHVLVGVSLAPWALDRLELGPRCRGALAVLLVCGVGLGLSELAAAPARLRDARRAQSHARALAARVDTGPPGLATPLFVLGGPPDVYLASRRPCSDAHVVTALLVAQEAERGDFARVQAILARRPVIVFRESGETALLDRAWPGWRHVLDGRVRETAGDGVTTIFR